MELRVIFYDAELEMGSVRRCNYPGIFQFNGFSAYLVEQADARTKQDGDEVNLYLFNEARFQELLGRTRAAANHHISMTGGSFRLF